MYFHIKLIAEWENNQIKAIEIEQNDEKISKIAMIESRRYT